ncbi:MAG: hypothetical protein COA79_15655 [Planctomycetota bacterium]|nr:MAG: hypothetical protein COA79_15655 [Planctomycetota bacterium]
MLVKTHMLKDINMLHNQVVNYKFLFLLLVGCILCNAVNAEDYKDPKVAIIVNKKSSLDTLTMKQLKKIFRADLKYWKADNKRIILLLRSSGTPEKAIALKRIFEMSERDLKKHWTAKIFEQKLVKAPKAIKHSRSAKVLVSKIPSSISLVVVKNNEELAELNKTVKVLTIEGSSVSSKNYILTKSLF